MRRTVIVDVSWPSKGPLVALAIVLVGDGAWKLMEDFWGFGKDCRGENVALLVLFVDVS